jgi:RNA polymerase sigma factor (sigma-70 family)
MATTAPIADRPTTFPPVGMLDDARLASRAADGDERAFEELYRRHSGPLYRYCGSIVGNTHEAEEALQSAMFSAYRALHEGVPVLQFRAWLYRIAHNHCLDILRRRREAHELDGTEEERGLRVDEQVVLREDLRQLRRDLAALDAAQRAALVLREMSGLSHGEIALALDTTPATAKQLIHDARRNLVAFDSGRGLPCDGVQRAISDGDGRVLRGGAVRGHLRACPECTAYRAAIGERRQRLAALFPPLAPLAAKGILASIFGAEAGSGGGALLAGGLGGGALAGGLAVQVAVIGVAVVAGTLAVGLPLGLAERTSGPERPTASASSRERAAAQHVADAAPAAPAGPALQRAATPGRAPGAPLAAEATDRGVGQHRPAEEPPGQEDVAELVVSADSLGAEVPAAWDPAAGAVAANRIADRLRAALAARALNLKADNRLASTAVHASRSSMSATASVGAGPLAGSVLVGRVAPHAAVATPGGAIEAGPVVP